MYLMAAPQARGLFHKAIAQSAYMVSAQELRTTTYGGFAAEAVGTSLADKLGKTDLSGLRSLDAAKLTDGAVRRGLLSVLQHRWPDPAAPGHRRNRPRRAPRRYRFSRDSTAARSAPCAALASQPPADAATYEKQIREKYADLADRFLELYPSSDMPESVLATVRDSLYGWTAERLVSKQTALGVPSFLYLFDHGYPAADSAGLHAFHASELPYVFGTADRTPPLWPAVPKTPAEARLSDAMTDYWASFARSGVPSAAGQPQWPAYGAERAYLAFEDVARAKTHLMPGMFEFNEKVVCRRRAQGGIPWHWNVGLASPPMPPEAAQCR